MKTAFISGITGQDGSYLAELLLDKGYEVHGILRRASTFNTARIDHIFDNKNLKLYHGDLTDRECLVSLLKRIKPNEVYNLAAQSHVRVSFDIPEYTFDVVAKGAINVFEAIRVSCPEAEVYQASSSEMFGNEEGPQSEKTPLKPVSPYGLAKVCAHHAADFYRQCYGLKIHSAILFNHESERRGRTFVTRKITLAAANIVAGKQSSLALGNLNAKRDWGYAPEYVELMWKMLNMPNHGYWTVVAGTGETHTVGEFVEEVFKLASLEPFKYLIHDSKYNRLVDVNYLQADCSLAKRLYDWSPSITFKQLAERMYRSDLEGVRNGQSI